MSWCPHRTLPEQERSSGSGRIWGDPANQLADALVSLTDAGALVASSGVYRSAPVGGPSQPPFLNLVAELDVPDGPYELLARCNALESAARRVRLQRWGPRTLDVDVLLFGDLVLDDPALTIPHPRMRERRFVLDPLTELAPELVSAGQRRAVANQDCVRIADWAELRSLAASSPQA